MTMTWQLQLSEFSGVRPAPLNEPAITYLWTTEQSINLFKLSTLTGYIRQTVVDMMNFDQLKHALFICFAKICPTCFHEFLRYKTKPLADFGIFSFACFYYIFLHVKSHSDFFSHVMKVLLSKNPPIQGIKRSQWSNIVISGLALICLFTSTVSFAQRKRMKQHEATGNNTFVAKWRCPLSPFPNLQRI